MLKAGFAGTDKPEVIFSSAVGRIKHKQTSIVSSGKLDGADLFVGRKMQEHRGLLRISYPMENGIVKQWEDMERVWNHVYSRDCLGINSEDHPVLLTEAPLNPYKNREKAAEVFFETFHVPAMYCSPQAILSLYASGRTTGLVLDSGDGVTHAVPVYEGFALPHAIQRVHVAGRDVTKRLQRLLRRSGYNLQTSAELEIVRKIKEDCCYVAFNSEKEESLGVTSRSYRLPDGELIQLGKECFWAPEVLFRPDLIGSEEMNMPSCLVMALSNSDRDLRTVLYKSIVLSGGSTLYKGYGDRLLNEVRKLSPQGIKITMTAPKERQWSTWVGGSILASLATFNAMWVTREDYNENGAKRLLDSVL